MTVWRNKKNILAVVINDVLFYDRLYQDRQIELIKDRGYHEKVVVPYVVLKQLANSKLGRWKKYYGNGLYFKECIN